MGAAKKIIAGVVAASLAAGGAAGGLSYAKKHNVKPVNVCSVASLQYDDYMPDEVYLDGSVTANVTQTISLAKDLIVDDVFVGEGDEVHVGDQLVSFDTTLVDMKLEIAKLKIMKMETELNAVLNRLEYVKAGGSLSDLEETENSGSGEIDMVEDPDASSESDSVTEDSDDEWLMGKAASPTGNLLAAAIRPVVLLGTALTDIFVAGPEEDKAFTEAGDQIIFEDTPASAVIQPEQNVIFTDDAQTYADPGQTYADPAQPVIVDPGVGSATDNTAAPAAADSTEIVFSEEEFTGTTDSYSYDYDEDSDFDNSNGLANYESQQAEEESIFSANAAGTDVITFSSGTGASYFPWLSPAPSPDGSYSTDYSASQIVAVDGDEPFYQKLDWDTVPYCGTGTEDNPFVYLCSCAKGKVEVTGGFLNIMAGYNAEGNIILHPGGYWYRLEFHKYDTIADYSDREASCTGYYLINGSMLSKSVSRINETEFSLEEAIAGKGAQEDEYGESEEGEEEEEEEEPEEEEEEDLEEEEEELEDEEGEEDEEEEGADTTLSREDTIKSLEKEVTSLSLSLEEADISLSKLEKTAARKMIYSRIEGSVAKVGDISKTDTAFITIKSSEGYFVRGSISELMLDEINVGSTLNCQDWMSGSEFRATIIDVSEYPTTYDGYSDGNPNVSYYSYTASINDKDAKVSDMDYLNVTPVKETSQADGIVLEKAFVRSENGNYYVYKAVDGVLKKTYITVKSNVDSGTSVLISGGLKTSDLIAFPYGQDVVEGAPVVEVDGDVIRGYSEF